MVVGSRSRSPHAWLQLLAVWLGDWGTLGNLLNFFLLLVLHCKTGLTIMLSYNNGVVIK